MKVIKDLSIEIVGTNAHYFRLDEYSEDNNDEILLYGYHILENKAIQELVSKYKRKVYLNVTMPTEFCGSVSTLQDAFFDEVYAICPYSVNWLNEITNSNKYKVIFYPFSHKDIPQKNEKKYDVCYHGGIHGNYHVECLNIMRKFNYRYMALLHGGITVLTQNSVPYATDINLSNQQKLDLIAQCKISICYNYFPIKHNKEISIIKNRKDWFKNEAFKHIDDLRIIPQIKSRLNEAAMAKTLNLVQRDPWNLVELFYKPDIDFVYFDSNSELEDKIREILSNWDSYLPMIESAYQKSLEYTAEKLYLKIKNNKNDKN